MVAHRVKWVAASQEAGWPPEELETGVLCTDAEDRPLMVAPKPGARRLGLACRLAGVVIVDSHKRLWLRRAASAELFPGLWNVTAADLVRAEESREEAALRALAEQCWPEAGEVQADLFGHPLRVWQVSSSVPGCNRLHVTLFRTPATPAMLSRTEASPDDMRLTSAELHGLVHEAPELFSPVVRWLASLE